MIPQMLKTVLKTESRFEKLFPAAFQQPYPWQTTQSSYGYGSQGQQGQQQAFAAPQPPQAPQVSQEVIPSALIDLETKGEM